MEAAHESNASAGLYVHGVAISPLHPNVSRMCVCVCSVAVADCFLQCRIYLSYLFARLIFAYLSVRPAIFLVNFGWTLFRPPGRRIPALGSAASVCDPYHGGENTRRDAESGIRCTALRLRTLLSLFWSLFGRLQLFALVPCFLPDVLWLFFVVSFFGAFLFVGWLSSGYVLKQQAAEGEGGYRGQQCFATGANLSIQRWRTGQRKQW